ncbi:hypothetical protein MKW98_004273 [Papaver atlanticum]|uniref:Uncharacterized protein n=1 Tax=Papaver atlanticum TaxID=357466 RepID=A0AAD4T921_9MAGN|nr:hypothetical protein MKW98_004273 [Papaver atlanticum]
MFSLRKQVKSIDLEHTSSFVLSGLGYKRLLIKQKVVMDFENHPRIEGKSSRIVADVFKRIQCLFKMDEKLMLQLYFTCSPGWGTNGGMSTFSVSFIRSEDQSGVHGC